MSHLPEPKPEPASELLPNPMNHPDEPPVGTDGTPRFGRLLIVLALAVLLIVAVTVGSQAYFS